MTSSSSAAISSSSAAASSSSAVVSSSSSAASSSSLICLPERFSLCDGVTPDPTDRELITATSGTPRGIAGVVEVGMTRAQVKTSLTASDPELVFPGTPMDSAPLHTVHCVSRVEVTYADRLNPDGGLDGFLTDDDVAVRITTLEGFPGHTDTMLRGGTARTVVGGAYPADSDKVSTNRAFPGWARDLWPVSGRAFTYNADGGVLNMSTHQGIPAAAVPMVLTMKNRRLKVGAVNIDAKLPGADVTPGTAFSVVKGALGPPDEEGFGITEIGTPRAIASLAYMNLGLRFYALASGTVLNQQTVVLIFMGPPFTNLDSQSGVGLGSTRAEFANALCTGLPCFSEIAAQLTLSGITLQYYLVGNASFSGAYMGVQFVPDENCVERAALLVLNIPPPM